MAQKPQTPLIDNEGEARTPTAEEWLWSIRTQDFGGDTFAVRDFALRREEIVRAAEAAGIPRAAFLHLAPNKPGFEGRVAEAFGAVVRTVKHAAE